MIFLPSPLISFFSIWVIIPACWKRRSQISFLQCEEKFIKTLPCMCVCVCVCALIRLGEQHVSPLSASLPDDSRCVAQADVAGRWLSSSSLQRSQSHLFQRWRWNINSIVTKKTGRILPISTTSTVKRKNNRKKIDLEFTLKFSYNFI